MPATAEPPARSARDAAAPGTVDLVAVAGGEAASVSVRSPAKETANEDTLVIVPLGPTSAVLAVADGVGGERGGAEASRAAVAALVEAVGAPGVGGERPLRVAILDGIERANQAVLERGGGATTLAVVEIDDGHARAYHVGDSLILHVGQRGRVRHRSVPHGPVGYGVAAGLIDDQDALHHDDLHLVSNVVGSADMRIEIGPRRPLAPRDTVLLATDGLSDNLYLDEIVEIARRGPAAGCATRLAALAARRMAAVDDGAPHKPDDLTFVLFRPLRAAAGRRG